MGFAVCEAARDRGARVTLVAGTVAAPIPAGVEVLRAETAADMQAALASLVLAPTGAAGFDALVMTAAVADFRPAVTAPRKIARIGAGLTLELRANPDLLAGLGRRVDGLDETGAPSGAPILPRPVLVGFAAETGGLERAAGKLRAKRVDLLVANDVSEPGSGFGTSTNRVTLFAADGGSEALPLLPKRIVAERILDRVAALLDARDAAAQTGATSVAGGTAS
jgi:phosphopantothenoylcysteine decarboxylase/phosphopantothenate--cysteine ligase